MKILDGTDCQTDQCHTANVTAHSGIATTVR